MTNQLRPPSISPALRRFADRAGAALAPNARRRVSPPPGVDHVVIEGRAEPVGGRAAGAEAYRGAAHPAPSDDAGGSDDFRLVSSPVDLRNGQMVERFLPDILGRALARSWVDPGFRARLSDDPKGLLHDHGVHLPAAIWIETQTGANQRPMLVVHERQNDGSLRRLLYLQLVMLAGK